MIPPLQFRDSVIRPVLHHLWTTDKRLGCRAAERLLLGTAIAESDLTYLEQIGDGPAITFFGIEPTTFDDTYKRYLPQRQPALLEAVNQLRIPAIEDDLDQLRSNALFACAIARIKYFMIPEPLPRHDDLVALGQYYKNWYNSKGGAGSAAKWEHKYRKFVPKGE